VHRTVSMQETAFYLMAYADKLAREFAKGSKAYNYVTSNTESISGESVLPASVTNYTSVVKVQKKANITPENIGQLFLMQIPGISSTIALEIMKPFKSFLEFVEHVKQNPAYLDNIRIGSRKLGSNVVKSIQSYIFCKENI
jgi:hypothetical protein